MSRLEDLESAIQSLTPEELEQFRAWWAEFDWQVWDRQLERDAKAGKLDSLADQALRDHEAGRSKPL
jgi:hypothetical protein